MIAHSSISRVLKLWFSVVGHTFLLILNICEIEMILIFIKYLNLIWWCPDCYFSLKSCIKFIGCIGVCAHNTEEHGLYCLLFLSRKVPQGRDCFLSLLVLWKPHTLPGMLWASHKETKTIYRKTHIEKEFSFNKKILLF